MAASCSGKVIEFCGRDTDEEYEEIDAEYQRIDGALVHRDPIPQDGADRMTESLVHSAKSNGNEVTVPDLDPNLWSSLREELIEKIIARLPLKSLIQSQTLSKKWRDLFLSAPFQHEVSSVSSRWGSYYPLYVSDKELMGYDRTSSKWQELFSLPEFPEDFCRGFSGPLAWTLSLCSVTGSLIILSYFSNHTLHIFVSNPINKSVRRLPPLDLTHDSPLDPRFDEWDDSVLVLPVSSYSYKVLVFTRNAAMNVLQVRVYHSHLNTWTEPQRGPVLPGDFRGLDSGGYLGKIFYLAFLKSIDETPCTLRSCLEDLMLFYAYDVDDGVFKEVVLPSPQKVPDVPIRVCKLVACGSDLMLVVGQGSRDQDEEQRQESIRAQASNGIEVDDNLPDYSFSQEYLYIPKESFLVFRLDLKTLQLTEVTRGPAEKLSSRTFTGLVVCDKDCIYLQTESAYGENEFGVVMFDMRLQVWTCLPLEASTPCFDVENTSLTDFAFQPGLHPFAVA
ncbi:unnamed protein product [Calypogeia fissa]